MDKKQIALRLDVDLLAKIDARAESVGLSRNEWFEKCVTWSIQNLPYQADLPTRVNVARSAPREVAGR